MDGPCHCVAWSLFPGYDLCPQSHHSLAARVSVSRLRRSWPSRSWWRRQRVRRRRHSRRANPPRNRLRRRRRSGYVGKNPLCGAMCVIPCCFCWFAVFEGEGVVWAGSGVCVFCVFAVCSTSNVPAKSFLGRVHRCIDFSIPLISFLVSVPLLSILCVCSPLRSFVCVSVCAL